MEDILLKNYLRYQKENQKGVLERLAQAPKSIIGLAILLLIGAIALIFFGIIPVSKGGYAIVLANLILIIVGNLYMDRYEIKTSYNALINHKEHSRNLLVWLQSLSFNATGDNIKEVVCRLNSNAQGKEDKIKNTLGRIEKWIQIVMIPIVLAVFGEIIRDDNGATILGYAITLIISVVAVALVFYDIYIILTFYKKYRIEQMRSFAKELQNILDTQFEDSMILPEKETEDTEV